MERCGYVLACLAMQGSTLSVDAHPRKQKYDRDTHRVLPRARATIASQEPITHIFQLLGNFSRCSVQFICDLFLSGGIQGYECLTQIAIDYVFDRVVI